MDSIYAIDSDAYTGLTVEEVEEVREKGHRAGFPPEDVEGKRLSEETARGRSREAALLNLATEGWKRR